MMKPCLPLILAILLLSTGPAAAVTDADVPGQLAPPAASASVEERRIRLAVQKELQRLQAREENLHTSELELKTLAAEVDKKLAEMTEIRRKVLSLLARFEARKEERILELSQIYEKMDPAQAAGLLSELDRPLAIKILSGIKKKTAGKILSNMERKAAAALSKEYPTLGDNPLAAP
jgi:flagellar motility protein MotE (MotC chaperone)